MNTHTALLSFCMVTLFFSCQSKIGSVTVLSVDNSPLIVCDEAKVNDKKEIKLSNFTDTLQLIRLESKDDAFFKFQWLALSDNYICIWQRDGGAVKLFDKTGKFISDIGSVGQGPGEYRFIYDALIDEAGGYIYLSSYMEKSILQYNLQGKFLAKIDLGETLNKPRLFRNPDSSISLVHLCFKDKDDKFVAATILPSDIDSIRYTYAEELATSFKNQEGEKVGLNHEIWSYRNVSDFPFMLTSTDTLYHYNSIKNEIKAHFTLKMDAEKKGDSFFIFNELPHHYLVFIVGEKGQTILVNKETHEAFHATILNNWLGNMNAFPRFQDGYYFDIFEPAVLKEKLLNQLSSGNCPKEQVEKLKELAASLNDNDNNVLLLGKLKK